MTLAARLERLLLIKIAPCRQFDNLSTACGVSQLAGSKVGATENERTPKAVLHARQPQAGRRGENADANGARQPGERAGER
jgi:hypothetical protein